MSNVRFAVAGVDTDAAKLFLNKLEDQDDLKLGALFPLEKFPEDYDAIRFREKNYLIERLDDFDFSQAKIAIFFGSARNIKDAVFRASEEGCYIIDATGSLSGEDNTLLSIPEVNGRDIISQADRILVSPHAGTIAVTLAMQGIADAFSLDALSVTALESVSSLGASGASELVGQTVSVLNGKPAVNKIYPTQVAFNIIPSSRIKGDFGNLNEQSVIEEIQQFLGAPATTGSVSYHSLTVPVFYGHTYLVTFETSVDVSLSELEEIWKNSEFIDYQTEEVVTPVTHGVDHDKICICELKKGLRPREFSFYMVMDNTLTGNALNCIGILRQLVENVV
ncbi:MAG: Asd/ArgC dimerization domain-containing protein [Succinivibrionaceae bacterium]